MVDTPDLIFKLLNKPSPLALILPEAVILVSVKINPLDVILPPITASPVVLNDAETVLLSIDTGWSIFILVPVPEVLV